MNLKLLLKPRALFFRWLHKPRMLRNFYIKANGEVAKNTRFSSTTIFLNKEKVNIGDNVYIGHYCILDGGYGLDIEDGCQIASKSTILTHSTHMDIGLRNNKHYLEYINSGGTIHEAQSGRTKIGEHTFIGTNTTINYGISIGRECIIGANSFVNMNLPDYSIAYGVPAKIVGDTRILDKQFLDNNNIVQRNINTAI